MDIVTTTLFSRGTEDKAWPEQTLIVPQHGLLASADAPNRGDNGRAGIRIALDAVRGHVERNADVIQRFVRNPDVALRNRLMAVVDECFARAAQEVYAFARRRDDVVITMDVCLLLHHEAFIGHVGDGRIYLVRRGLVHQLTVDHVHNETAEALGVDTIDLLGDDPSAAKALTRALGSEPRVPVESMCMELFPEDRFVCTTASLYKVLPEQLLHTRLSSEHLDSLLETCVRDAGTSAFAAAIGQNGSGEPFQLDSAQSRLAILKPMPLFAHCTSRELRAVAAATRPHCFEKGQVIFNQGDPGTEIYLVISGEVQIQKGGKPIVTLGPGSNFGEMAMLDEPIRSAAAVAWENCELMVFPREAFFGLLKGNPLLAVKILWNMLLRLSANLRTTNERLQLANTKLLKLLEEAQDAAE